MRERNEDEMNIRRGWGNNTGEKTDGNEYMKWKNIQKNESEGAILF
jgi:hypothetical protein